MEGETWSAVSYAGFVPNKVCEVFKALDMILKSHFRLLLVLSDCSTAKNTDRLARRKGTYGKNIRWSEQFCGVIFRYALILAFLMTPFRTFALTSDNGRDVESTAPRWDELGGFRSDCTGRGPLR